MSVHENYAIEVSSALQRHKAVFMVGAGASFGRNTWLPGWNELIYNLLKIIAGPDRYSDVEYISKNHMQLLFNEAFLQKMTNVLGLSATAEALKIFMDTNAYNPIHKFLSWTMLNFGSIVLTTNYDELIERAGGNRAKLFMLHGTLKELEKARFTVNHIFAPLDSNTTACIYPELAESTLIVIGYRGADLFDVIPILFSKQANVRNFVWITHGSPDDDLDPNTKKLLDERGDPCFKADADEFLNEVYTQTKRFAKGDDELDRWEVNHTINSNEWWRGELDRWKEELYEKKQSKLDFLWAQILDYLRIYQLKNNVHEGDARKPAEEAYLRFLKTKPETIHALEAKLQLAYIKRTTGTETCSDLQTIIKIIWDMLDKETIDRNRHNLQRLLTMAYHQLGIALQNKGRHSQASSKLDEAILLRRFTSDPEVAYSFFQKFINGRQAYMDKKIDSINELAPGWRDTLVSQLEQSVTLFKESSEPGHYGTTLHNLAFVHQVLASEHEESSRFKEANAEFEKACELCEAAKVVREQLQDPRMIAQSNVRIAECKLGLARYMLRTGEKNSVCRFMDDADVLVKKVKQHYDRIPQETIRKVDLGNIEKEIERLRQEANCSKSWL